ncbi:MAG: radical SAM family heme chaperone HemW [Acholeplasmataceae bacterium]|nr:radical SAM family heme chaperone HemW [Acholeplasmataceae bacterium]
MIEGLYIHIPFCHQICRYCDFVKMVPQKGMPSIYVEHLIRELESNIPLLTNLKTIYFGGGTPTLLDQSLLARLFEAISHRLNLSLLEEYTIEANPNDITKTLGAMFVQHGINRVSLGVQTFSPHLLTFLGRTHRPDDIGRAIQELRASGIKNINIDLIYAIPGQSIQDLKMDLNQVLGCHPQHISAYNLILEEKTILYHAYQNQQFEFLDDELELEMSDLIESTLLEAGYHRYEISNYALPGYESKHNLLVWNLEEYLGIGMGSHSQYQRKRLVNHTTFSSYIAAIDEIGLGFAHEEPYEPEIEFVMLGLRKTAGIDVDRFETLFGQPIFQRFPELKHHLATGLLEKKGRQLQLTKQGLDLANQVFVTLF